LYLIVPKTEKTMQIQSQIKLLSDEFA
jgi:hypothetical protein